MYRDNGGADLISASVDYEFQWQQVQSDATPIGSVTIISGTVTDRKQGLVARTIRERLSPNGSPIFYRIRAKRDSPRSTASGNTVDEMQWRDLFSLTHIASTTLPNITYIQTRTVATDSALAITERELNCVATEMVNVYEGNGVFASTKTANRDAVQSFIRLALDQYVGNRLIGELDADNLLALSTSVENYFGSANFIECSYTFDSTKSTFQDIGQILFDAMFCFAQRNLNGLTAVFDGPKMIPSMLFTHRSKIPNAETYSRDFFRVNDSIELAYKSNVTNDIEYIYLPNQNQAIRPKRLEIPGIRNANQAAKRAAREYNKLLNQRESLEFTSTAEGRYIPLGGMIEVVKNSRINTADGDVMSVNGLELTLSQNVQFTSGDTHSITLKKSDGSTEGITCTAGANSNQVVLSSAPSEAIRTDPIAGRRTEFSFGNEARHLADLWIPQRIDATAIYEVGVSCINYDAAYYADDLT